MYIEPFGVELWMNEFETRCEFNLAETCVDSLTVAELLAFANLTGGELVEQLLPIRLDYGAIEGSQRLRTAIAALYETIPAERTLVTHGAIGANSLVHQTLVGAGNRVVTLVPNYQQHRSIPESLGADVHCVSLRPENRYLPDLDELAAAAPAGTTLIALSNPNNPTGSLIEGAMLEGVVQIARDCGAYLLFDEVYRGTDQHGDGTTASVADIYDRGISTGSMSKAFSLAGLRLGWIAGPGDVLKRVSLHRDYNTISVGVIDDHLACLALENAAQILGRSRAITRRNLGLLGDWIASEPSLSWVRSRSGTTALVNYDLPMASRDFCVALLRETGVLFTPGSVLGVEGTIRVGYANHVEVLAEGLSRTSAFLAAHC
ncbi:aminotransferase class I/II-fold pyridoxal phosphate-dependent enzyme [Acidimicrobiaceae bacterium AH-315-P05]|nr:aminotransferase class I/II-fold pyridoxal phosphate-dependent enzyme [Acidimicrobiaceae bacterium AH-315-P05]